MFFNGGKKKITVLCCSYSKRENLTVDDPEMLQFTHLLMEARSKYSPNMKPYLKTHDIIDSIDGFSHIGLNYNMLPPIRIKTKPSIFILKRKSDIKYDPNEARTTDVFVQDFPEQTDNAENVELSVSHETAKEVEPIFDDIVEPPLEEFEKSAETNEQNFSDIEKIKKITNNNAEEEVEKLDDFADDDASVENIQIENKNNLLLNLKKKKEEKEDDSDPQKVFESVSDVDDSAKKSDGRIKTKIEERKIVKGRSKVNLNSRQENHSVKETVKRILQEKMQEVKQRREANDERRNAEFPIKPTKRGGIVGPELPRRARILKKPREMPAFAAKPATTEESKIAKERIEDMGKDDKRQKFIKAKSVTRMADKIGATKPVGVEQIVEEEDIIAKRENESITADATMETVGVREVVNAELPYDRKERASKEKTAEGEDREEDAKAPKATNVRESIRNIIDQFKEFEKDFAYDDAETTTTSSDDAENDDVAEDDRVARSGESVRLASRDPRESLKEIIDQFKYIKHELTSEEDDQFDEIAAKYMERPIAETLLQFNEALKALTQRRRKTSSRRERPANVVHDDEDDGAISAESRGRAGETARAATELPAEETAAAEKENSNERTKARSRRDSVVANRPKRNPLNPAHPSANEDIDVLASTEDDAPLEPGRYNDNDSNDVLNNKIDAAKKESSQKSMVENDRSD